MSLRDELQGRISVKLRGVRRSVRNVIEDERDLDKRDRERMLHAARVKAAERRRDKPEEVRATVKRWRDANPERVRELRKKWLRKNPTKAKAMWAKTARRRYHADPEAARAKQRAYYQANRERILQRERDRRAKDPESDRERCRRWQKAHRETLMAVKKAYRAKNRKRLNADGLARYHRNREQINAARRAKYAATKGKR